MFERIFKKTKKKKSFRLNGASPLDLFLTAGLIPLFGIRALNYWLVRQNPIVALGYAAAALGSAGRLIMRLDNWAVTRFLEGRSGPLSRFITERLWNNPLRFVTLNRLAQRLDNWQLKDELKALHDQRKTQRTETVTLAIKEKHTVKYLLNATDPRKHLRAVVVLALSVASGIKMLTSFSDPAHKMTPAQIGGRVGGYLLGLVISSAHLTAWIQRRSAEENASPFFTLSHRVLVRTPLPRLGRALIRWDYYWAQNVLTGRQTWAWRKRRALYARLPQGRIRTWFLEGLDAKKRTLTPAVQQAMEENGTTLRLAAMEKVLSGEADKAAKLAPLPTWQEWKTAAREMMDRNREFAEQTLAVFQNYVQRAQESQEEPPATEQVTPDSKTPAPLNDTNPRKSLLTFWRKKGARDHGM